MRIERAGTHTRPGVAAMGATPALKDSQVRAQQRKAHSLTVQSTRQKPHFCKLTVFVYNLPGLTRPLFKSRNKGCRDGSSVKSTDCFCREPTVAHSHPSDQVQRT